MKLHKSTEITLDDFLNLPRRAQLFFFEDLETSMISGKDNYYNYSVSDAFNTENCKSPIEQILSMALSVYSNSRRFEFECQKEIRTKSGKHYFADFAMLFYDEELDDFKIVVLVECDGHEFHEKTKAQVKNRNERDYDLKMDGYDILHFSGSQIYEDPFACAKEIYDYCENKMGSE